MSVLFGKIKSEVFTFKKFKVIVERESGREIKAMRSDREDEFISKEFQEYCEDKRSSLTTDNSMIPQQNEVAKRKNRTIINMARSMHKNKRMPKEFRVKFVASVVYLSNC